MLQPAEYVRVVDARHFPWLAPQEQVLVAWLLEGYTIPELARALAISEATANRWRRNMSDEIFEMTEVLPAPSRLVFWAFRHLDCCLPGTRELIETGHVVSGTSQRKR
jgi:hypothetical protein